MSVIKIEKALKLDKVIFVDVRTEGEYEEDHILNAINMPLFKNNEHNEVGTIYKMQENMKQYKKGLTMYRIN
ncbi:rhodanese-like domain-containing protein [Clostridioides difficile]|nr:rhodanese-like domain-containing protein [Clostridioides difficile]